MFWKHFRSWLRKEFGKPVRKIPKKVYLIRHPHTNDEDDGTYRGEFAEVTEKGREQSRVVAERIAEINADVIVTSTFPRSIHLANVLRERCQVGHGPIEVIPTELFVECRKPGFMVNGSRKHPRTVRVMERHRKFFDWYYRHSDEENRWMLERRAHKAFRFLAELDKECVVVVTHGKFLRVLWHYLYEGGTLWGFYWMADRLLRHDNTGITVLELAPNYRTGKIQWNSVSWNDRGHTEAFVPPDILRALAGKP